MTVINKCIPVMNCSQCLAVSISPIKGTSTPYAVILLVDQIILNTDVILHCTITFQCIYGFGMLRQRITGIFKRF